MAKKKLLELVINKKYDGQYSIYEHPNFSYAYCKEPEKGIVKQITEFCGCREDLSDQLYNNRTRIPLNCLRLLVRIVMVKVDKPNATKVAHDKQAIKNFGKHTKVGLRILNIMEKRHKWPLTQMFAVEPHIDERHIDGWNEVSRSMTYTTYLKMLEASNKWMRSPHMISLFALLFRLPNKLPKQFQSIKNYKDLEEACKRCRGADSGDRHYVATTFRFWDPLMANFDKVFDGLPFTKAYSTKNYSQYHYNEGIYKLCTFESSNSLISNQFAKVMKEAGLK